MKPERLRNAALVAYFGSGVQIVSGVVLLPYGISHLGATKYGVWLTLASLAAYLGNGNFGVPLAALTLLGKATREDERRGIARRSLSIILLFSLLLSAIAASAAAFIPRLWQPLFGAILGQTTDVVTCADVLVLGTCLLLPFTMYPNLFTGWQRISTGQAYLTARITARLIASFYVLSTWKSLTSLAVGVVLADLIVGSTCLCHFRLRIGSLRRAPVDKAANTLTRLSGGYFLLLIETTIITNTDTVVLASILGPTAVTHYVSVLRLYQLASNSTALILTPLWPRLSAAYARNDWNYLQVIYRRFSEYLLQLGGLIWVGGVAFGPVLLRGWLGKGYHVDSSELFILGAYAACFSYLSLASVFLNSMGRLAGQAVVGGLEAVLNLGLSILLTLRYGEEGVALGTLIAAGTASLWLVPLVLKKRTMNQVYVHPRAIIETLGPYIICACTLVSISSPGARATCGIALLIILVLVASRRITRLHAQLGIPTSSKWPSLASLRHKRFHELTNASQEEGTPQRVKGES